MRQRGRALAAYNAARPFLPGCKDNIIAGRSMPASLRAFGVARQQNRGRAPGAASACYKTTPTRQCLIAIVFKVVKPYSASNPFSRP